MKHLFFSASVLLLLGAGCVSGPSSDTSAEKVWKQDELLSLTETQTAAAIEAKDRSLCDVLPAHAKYQEITHGGGFELADRYPEAKCLMDYSKTLLDVNACARIDVLDNSSYRSYTCEEYIAEVKTDTAACDLISDKYLRADCRAKVLLDVSECYAVPPDDGETSAYSRSVGWCIIDVSRRTKDYSVCQQINGPDFGEQWQMMYTQCVQHRPIAGEEIPVRLETGT